MEEDCRFKIDFIEFAFLVEACIPPRTIARAMFWERVIDEYYHVLTPEERKRLYEWINLNPGYKHGIENHNEDCLLFEARYNPDNQYRITTIYNDKEETHDCFLWNRGYQLTKSTSIIDEYIKNIEKI